MKYGKRCSENKIKIEISTDLHVLQHKELKKKKRRDALVFLCVSQAEPSVLQKYLSDKHQILYKRYIQRTRPI